MSFRRLLLLPVLLPVLAACTLPGSDAAEAENCAEEFTRGAGMATASAFDEEELKDRIRHVCEEMVRAGLSDDSSEAELFAFLREHPQLAGELCEASTDVLYAEGLGQIVVAFDGYVTRDDLLRLARDGCVYAYTQGYGSLTGGPDLPSLFRAHPDLVAPFCRAPLMQAYDAKKPTQPRRVYEEVVTEVCMEGVRTGVVDYSSGNFLNPSIDQKRFRALLDQEWANRSSS